KDDRRLGRRKTLADQVPADREEDEDANKTEDRLTAGKEHQRVVILRILGEQKRMRQDDRKRGEKAQQVEIVLPIHKTVPFDPRQRTRRPLHPDPVTGALAPQPGIVNRGYTDLERCPMRVRLSVRLLVPCLLCLVSLSGCMWSARNEGLTATGPNAFLYSA